MRRRMLVALGCVVVFAGVSAVRKHRVDARRDRFLSAFEWLDRCGRLNLTMTREELVQRMGPPARTVEEGAREVLYFPHPELGTEWPRAYVDARRQRVDEVYCNAKTQARMTPKMWEDWDKYQEYRRRIERDSTSRDGEAVN